MVVECEMGLPEKSFYDALSSRLSREETEDLGGTDSLATRLRLQQGGLRTCSYMMPLTLVSQRAAMWSLSSGKPEAKTSLVRSAVTCVNDGMHHSRHYFFDA